MTSVDLNTLLHPRILKHSLPSYNDKYYKHAALEAMIQVELALKERVERADISEKGYGVQLVKRLLGTDHPGIKLRVPFGEELQSEAETLFEGAFKLYRNYCAHEDSEIDPTVGLRVMVLASELLDLIGASFLSFADLGGIDGLMEAGAFKDRDELLSLLSFLDGYTLPDEATDGFFEDFYDKGFGDSQLDAVLELELVCYQTKDYVPPIEMRDDPMNPDTIAWFELTGLGKQAIAEGGGTLHERDSQPQRL